MHTHESVVRRLEQNLSIPATGIKSSDSLVLKKGIDLAQHIRVMSYLVKYV